MTLAWNKNWYQSSLSIILFFNLSFNIFFHFFQNFLISSSLHLSKSFCSKLYLPRKILCSKTCAIHLLHSLLPLPKRIRQGLTAWILFVSLFCLFQKNKGLITWILFMSLFSLFQKNKGLTTWILLCLPSRLSKNSKWHSLRILLILPFPLSKSIQRTNCLRILLYPHSQSIKGLTVWHLCLNTLEGTSFVVQVEGTSTWVWLRTREGTSLVDQF